MSKKQASRFVVDRKPIKARLDEANLRGEAVRNHYRSRTSLLAIRNPRELLKKIAQEALDELEADVVTLYEYRAGESSVVIPPIHAGKFRETEALGQKAPNDGGAIVYKLLQRNKPFLQ